MAAEIETAEPESFRVGDTFKFKKYLADYDPALDTLNYRIANATNIYSVTCTDNGDGYFLANVLPSVTETWIDGTYSWQSYITNGADRFTVASGTVKFLPDLSKGAVDTRSHVKKTLDALEATIQGRATTDQLSYTINGRSMSKIPVEELIKWHSHYKALYKQELQNERILNGAGKSNIIRVRFNA